MKVKTNVLEERLRHLKKIAGVLGLLPVPFPKIEYGRSSEETGDKGFSIAVGNSHCDPGFYIAGLEFEIKQYEVLLRGKSEFRRYFK